MFAASGPVFEVAKSVGLRVGCENSGGFFDNLQGAAYQSAVQRFFNWSASHDTAVTFLISGGAKFFSSVPEFLSCEQKQLASGTLTSACKSPPLCPRHFQFHCERACCLFNRLRSLLHALPQWLVTGGATCRRGGRGGGRARRAGHQRAGREAGGRELAGDVESDPGRRAGH